MDIIQGVRVGVGELCGGGGRISVHDVFSSEMQHAPTCFTVHMGIP